MPDIAYIDGCYRSTHLPSIMLNDRGYQFADGIYEVCSVRAKRACDLTAHLARLHRSAAALSIAPLPADRVLSHIISEVIDLNRVSEGQVYIQVTRGVAPRDHIYRDTDAAPVLVVTAQRQSRHERARVHSNGIKVISMPDIRWGRVDIKSIALLPNIMARQTAYEAGAQEAWLVDAEGFITEGAATNAWIVDANGYLRTRPLSSQILGGVTRSTLIELIKSERIDFIEEAFTLEDAKNARECFSSATTMTLIPVVAIDTTIIGDGTPGPISKKLLERHTANSN